MPQIAIDCRFAHVRAGLGSYTRAIASRLVTDASVRWTLLLSPDAVPWASTLSGAFEADTVIAPHYSLREHVDLPRILRVHGADLLFAPHFNVPWFCPVPFVATVHDLILHRFPGDAPLHRRIAYRALMHRTVAKARRLIAVSAFTRSELASIYGVSAAEKTRVILEGVESSFRRWSVSEQAPVLQKHGLSAPFFLYVGSAKEHKRVQFLIDTFADANLLSERLVIVTGGRESERLSAPDRVTILRNVPDDDLPALYSAATAFVSASLYEGFGLPVAEAAACGCPVIAVRASAIPEVAPPGSMLIDPDRDALMEALRHPPSPPSPMTRSWDEAAEQTLEVLRLET